MVQVTHSSMLPVFTNECDACWCLQACQDTDHMAAVQRQPVQVCDLDNTMQSASCQHDTL